MLSQAACSQVHAPVVLCRRASSHCQVVLSEARESWRCPTGGAEHTRSSLLMVLITATHTFPSAGEPMLVLATISQLIAGSHAVRRTHAINVWQKFRLKI